MSGSEAPSTARAPRWSDLGLLGKIARLTAFAFVTTYLTLAVARPLPDEHWLKEQVAPLAKKVSRFRLSSPWRMFTSEAKFGFVVLQLETASGDRYEVESFRWEGKPWLDRVRDGRLRRMQAKLKQKHHRRKWGPHYLSYVCETTMRDLPDIKTIDIILGKPVILDRNGKQLSYETRQLIATFDCQTRRFTDGI